MAKRTAKDRIAIGAPALVVQAVVAAITLRDIAQRSDEQIRGPRRVWQLAVTVNTAGAVAYWIAGRKREG